MWLPDRLHRMRLIPLLMLLYLGYAGCAEVTFYVGPELSAVSIGELRQPPVPQMLNLRVKCSFPEVPLAEGAFCAGIQNSAQIILVESKLFSELAPAENIDQMTLDFELEQNRDSWMNQRISLRTLPLVIPVVAMAAILVGTVGIVGFTMPEENWNLTAEYTPVNGSAIRRQYHGSRYRSIGVIPITWPPSGSRQVGGFTSAPAADVGGGEVVRDLVLNFLRDLQQSGEL